MMESEVVSKLAMSRSRSALVEKRIEIYESNIEEIMNYENEGRFRKVIE
jgi:hypothetical protein